jgi:hypothetical protein
MRMNGWIMTALLVVLTFFVANMFSERFSVPIFPTKYADQRMITPAGNRITY